MCYNDKQHKRAKGPNKWLFLSKDSGLYAFLVTNFSKCVLMTKRFGPCGKNSRISTDSRIDEAKIGTPKDSDFLLLFGHRNSATSPKNASFP